MILAFKRFGGTAGLISAGACVLGCSSNPERASNASPSLTEGIVREGDTTGPALAEFLGTPGDDWGWAGGQFDAPADQAMLPAATPAAFAWHADPTTAPSPSDVLLPTEQNGQAFLLVFQSPNHPNLLRVFTSLTSYTPGAAAWQELVVAGEPISLSVNTATFENDQLTPDGGPYVGQTITITVQ